MFIYRCTENAVCICYNVMCTACVKSCYGISFFVCSKRKLRLISIIKRSFHPNDRLFCALQKFRWKTTDPYIYTPIGRHGWAAA